MTERAKLEASAPADAFWTILTHLQLVPSPELYAKLADLQVKHTYKLLPCHSSALAAQSKVLSTMFNDMSKEEWASGVTAALADHALKDVEIYLTLVHSPGETIESIMKADKHRGNTLEIAKLAHKLDSPLVLDKIDSYLVVVINTHKWNDPKDTRNLPLSWLPRVETFQMSKTKAACMIRVLGILNNELYRVADSEKMEIAKFPGCSKEILEALSSETLLVLLEGVLRARNTERQNRCTVPERNTQRWEARQREFWWKVGLFWFWLVVFASPIGFFFAIWRGLTHPEASCILPSRVYRYLKEKGVDRLPLPALSVVSLFLCWFFLGAFWICIFFVLLYSCWVIFCLAGLPLLLDWVEEEWKKTH